jgi:hypothetical protein
MENDSRRQLYRRALPKMRILFSSDPCWAESPFTAGKREGMARVTPGSTKL